MFFYIIFVVTASTRALEDESNSTTDPPIVNILVQADGLLKTGEILASIIGVVS